MYRVTTILLYRIKNIIIYPSKYPRGIERNESKSVFSFLLSFFLVQTLSLSLSVTKYADSCFLASHRVIHGDHLSPVVTLNMYEVWIRNKWISVRIDYREREGIGKTYLNPPSTSVRTTNSTHVFLTREYVYISPICKSLRHPVCVAFVAF